MSLSDSTFDIAVVGGGIVGLASAWQLLRRRPDARLLVLEKENHVAAHQSSRNSGVIHSGVYYRPGSLRALNCRRGYGLLLEFCQQYGLPYEICGKIIVATTPEERPALDVLYERGQANGLTGLRILGADEAREIEPHVRAVAALWVPQTGITDYGRVAQQLAELIAQAGGIIRTGARVQRLQTTSEGVRIEADTWEGVAKRVVTCAGLYSDHVALSSGARPEVRILPFRGEYYELKPEREHLVRNLIYPVPNPNFPFLGVHFTRRIAGGIEAGPNAVFAFRREGYRRWDIHPGELAEALAFRGFRRLARRYWRDGWAEMQRSFSKKHFVRALQRLVPELQPDDVLPARSGVRAMACTPEGHLHDDFLLLETPRILHVCNAPSPAATASLAIGETVAERVLKLA
ncbi:MAG: L-2-hydroxyglutarate oxidase [Saprospiraceae bacterium]|nr:L-2-hydroxyglutarate oxidase [Saprospiraceae bacterium]MDW8229976.1 L-2-hydroxyglutarate oxidase [Saprospiraceae bacterium]